MQHRANRSVRGRHRRTTALHTHRAPSTPISEKGRYAMAAAAVVGVGVAGVTTATDGTSSSPAAARERLQAASAQAGTQSAAQARTQAVAQDPVVATTAPPAPSTAPATTPVTSRALPAAAARRAATPASVAVTGLPFVVQARKLKPLPLWVDPLPEAAVTSCFGQRWGRLHAGVDLAAPDGTPIRAAGAGVVVAAGPAEGYGNAVLIDHGNGYLTHYGHMSAVAVTVGQRVVAGDAIGSEGSTGHSTGPHLHFEVHQGAYKNPVEPTRWLHEHGVDIAGCAPLTD